jgi:uncharacterized protein (TIGR00106 family)
VNVSSAAGLKTHLHAYDTNIEGDWDRVLAAEKQCHEALHAAGAPRISTSMRFGLASTATKRWKKRSPRRGEALIC